MVLDAALRLNRAVAASPSVVKPGHAAADEGQCRSRASHVPAGTLRAEQVIEQGVATRRFRRVGRCARIGTRSEVSRAGSCER